LWHTEPMAASPSAEKTLRRDAQRNHERIVASARALFARDGIDASVEAITRHAGLGTGTLYRHFPTKEDLIDAVLEDAFEELVQMAEQAAAAEDAWTGLTEFLEHAIALHAENRGLKDVMANTERGRVRAHAMRERMRPLLRSLIERAKSEGSLRADFASEDLPLVFWMSSRVIDATSSVAPETWRRFLALMLDGLRAENATPLPEPPLTTAQIQRAAKEHAR